MSSPLMRTWLTFAVICIICTIFPSIQNSLWRIRLSEKICTFLFPLRTLLGKKIICKNDLLKLYTDVRADGVHFVAVIWYAFALLAALFLLAAGAFLSEAALSMFLDVTTYFCLLCAVFIVIGIFVGDRKFYTRIRITEADVEVLHANEETIAHQIAEAIEREQAQLQALGYRWRVDILCTDRLEDKPIATAMGALSAFTGVPQTNPLYMSRISAAILDENNESVPFPVKRRSDVDISFTQGSNLLFYHADYIVPRVKDLVHDVTGMVLYCAQRKK